jgi:hypothetical protein
VLLGCDFSSAPSKRKKIVLAWGDLQRGRLQLTSLQALESLAEFSEALSDRDVWLGGFDLPFGLPRELVETLGWPLDWERCVHHYSAMTRADIRSRFANFCNARPVGGKFAHRATDIPAGSSASMKWVNPPVAFMMHAGVPLLLDAGAYFPGLQAQGPAQTHQKSKVALEAYPGMLAREVLGKRSYKSDDKSKQTADRFIARKDLINALELGQTSLAIRLKLTHSQRDKLVEDASGDSLDAVLCLMQAAWACDQHQQGHRLYGLPVDMDPLEGWIVTAQRGASAS